MVAPITDPTHCTDEECYFANLPTSYAISVGGKTIYVLADLDHYDELRRRTTLTYTVIGTDECGGLYRVTLQGSDGSVLPIHLTPEAVAHGLHFVAEAFEIKHLKLIA